MKHSGMQNKGVIHITPAPPHGATAKQGVTVEKSTRSEANKSETLANEPTATKTNPHLELAPAHTQCTPNGLE